MGAKTSYDTICGYMPDRVRQAMLRVCERDRVGLTEVRLHSDRPTAFVYPDRVRYLSPGGSLESSGKFSALVKTTSSELGAAVTALAHYSIHSCDRELRQGFFTLPGGIRVGLAGTYTSAGTMKDWNGLNFRISAAYPGCAGNVFPRLAGCRKGVLICGGVNSGKTTLLRDLCRICGDNYKTVLIDERGELAALSGGQPVFDVGLLTDIIAGCTRSEGILSGIRTLSPDFIFCDEVSGGSDTAAIIDGSGCGIRFAATFHARSYNELCSRESGRQLISEGTFDIAVFLTGSSSPGTVREIKQLCHAD